VYGAIESFLGVSVGLLLTLSSSLQAHHTVWRKLRQRAEKLVRRTKSDFKAEALETVVWSR